MKLTVIIVSYNVKFYVEQCLNSLEKALEGIDSEIFIVDNHSRDGSVSYLSKRYQDINIIDSSHNLGFARANNIAYRQSSGEYVLLLNPDTFVGEDTIRKAVDFMDEHPRAGGVGVKMLNPDGTFAKESRRGLPTPMTSFYKMCGLCERFPASRIFGRYYMSYLDRDEAARIEVISGAFFLLRRSATDAVGCLDEDFFMYGEDIDLSYRLLKGGFENWYLPQPIMHYKGESTHKTSFRYVHVFYQAMLIFFRKHYSHLGFWITLPIKTAIYAKAFMALIQMTLPNIRKAIGLMDRRAMDTRYIFIGRSKMVERCTSVARRYGLTSEFRTVDTPDVAMEQNMFGKIRTDMPVCVVYDTEIFGYATMLEIMSANTNDKIKLGTYSEKTKIIITPSEIIQ